MKVESYPRDEKGSAVIECDEREKICGTVLFPCDYISYRLDTIEEKVL